MKSLSKYKKNQNIMTTIDNRGYKIPIPISKADLEEYE